MQPLGCILGGREYKSNLLVAFWVGLREAAFSSVIPAKAGIHADPDQMDPRLRGDDGAELVPLDLILPRRVGRGSEESYCFEAVLSNERMAVASSLGRNGLRSSGALPTAASSADVSA
jgi:hypothetical protein